jgi:hypothetical protein
LWEVGTGKELRRFDLPANPKFDEVLIVNFSADGKLIAANSVQTGIHLWETGTGKEVRTLPGIAYDFIDNKPTTSAQRRHSRLLAKFGVTGPGPAHEYAFAQVAREVARCDLAARGLFLSAHGSARDPRDTFSPDGRTLASGDNGQLVLTELASLRARFESRRLGFISALTFSPDGRRLVCADGTDRVIRIWELADLIGAPHGKLSAARLAHLWDDLGDDPVRAYRAGWVFSKEPADALPFLERQAVPKGQVSAEKLEQLVADLDSRQFLARQKATQELEKLGPAASSALRRALARRPSLEVTMRAERVLNAVEERIEAEAVRGIRLTEVLERIGTTEARRVLQRLSAGPAVGGARTEQAAAEALQRLERSAKGR